MNLLIITGSQYTERIVLYIETAEFVPDGSELILFVQLQLAIRNRHYPLYITHIQSHIGLAIYWHKEMRTLNNYQRGNVLEASKYHEKPPC